MELTAAQWCELLGGTLEGDGSRRVLRPAAIEEGSEGTITFIASRKYQPLAYPSKAAVIIVPHDMQFEKPILPALIRVEHPYLAFARVLEIFEQQKTRPAGIHPSAIVDATAAVGSGVYLAPGAVVGAHSVVGNRVQLHANVCIGEHCHIGDDTVLYPGVVLYAGVRIGSRCRIHAATVIGSDGFGFAPQPDGSYRKIPQHGTVIIEDDVEIGAGCTIDRGTLGATIIRCGVKLDNLIHVAHNVEIGANTVIAAQAGIAGSTHIGKNCQIGGQAGIVGHLVIADNTRINAQSGVTKSITESGRAVTGSPAFEYTAALRAQSLLRRLPALMKQVQDLEKKIKELQNIPSEEKLT